MKDFFKIFGFFFTNYRKETLVTVALIIVAGLVEAIGLVAFLPFFQLVLEGDASLSHIPEGAFRNFFANSGVEINLGSVGGFIIVIMGLKAFILWVALRKVGKTVAKISANLRSRLLNALLSAKWSFFVHHRLGVSLNALVTETFTASTAFVSTARFISALVQLSVYSIGAFLLSWKMFVGAIVIGGLLACALWALVRIARAAGLSQMSLSKQMLSNMADMLQGMKPLRAMALEKKFMTLLTKHSKGLEKAQADQLITSQSMRVFHEPLMVLAAIGGMYGVVTYGNLATSELALMAIIFIRLLNSMNIAQGEFQRLMTQEATLWSLITTIKQTEESAEDWSGSAAPPKTIKSLEFKDVHFSHGDNKVLSGVNLDIKPHTLTALIGESGSGKTTLLDLLSGFYEAEQGSVIINDANINMLDLKAWRQTTGFVPQEVFLFNDSILENIRMGRDDLSEAEVWEAIKSAGALDFVEALPDKLKASVGEAGRRLSGGQKQRIAIARAIVHKPQILLLDEATSALDKNTEQVLLETLRDLSKEMTVILISHNLAVQQFADNIYRVKDGEVTKMSKKAA